MIKKSNSDEIDLLDILQIIWEKKKIVIFIIVLSVIVAIIMQSLAPPVKIKASTEIRPIGIIEENRYEIYNSTLISVGPSGDLDIIDKSRVTVEGTQKIVELKDIVFQIKQKELEKIRINNINKMLLFELFVDTISQRINLVNAIKKFNFIKEENYSTKIEYDDAINELVSSIKLKDLKDLDFTNDNLNLKIEFEAFNVENWEDFLKFLEEEMNKKVRLKLFEAFNDYKSYVNIITEYNIEDIKSALLLTEDEQKKNILK